MSTSIHASGSHQDGQSILSQKITISNSLRLGSNYPKSIADASEDHCKDPTSDGQSSGRDSDALSEDGSIPSNSNSDAESDIDESLSESQGAELNEVRYELSKLQRLPSMRRKSISTVIPNWPARNAEPFQRGKDVSARFVSIFIHMNRFQ
jgi:hypothetical protein